MRDLDFKKQLIAILILFLVFDIFLLAPLFATINGLEGNLFDKLPKFLEVFMQPFKVVIPTVFGNFGSFMTWSGIVFVVIFVMFLYWKITNSGNSSEYEGKESGSSEWSKNGEEFKKNPDGSENLNKHNGFILSRKHYLGTDLRKVKINKNILVIGGSGTGKSACYIKPNIMQMLGSYVITDPKGELYRETSKLLEQNGYNIRVLDLVDDPEFSDRYNPLAHIHDHADVDIIAHTIVNSGSNQGSSADPFWDNTAKMLLKACIYYVISVLPEEEQNLSSCLNIVRQGGADESIFDKLFVDELKPEHPGRKEYEGIRVGADKTKQSIAISLVSKLTHFDTPNMQKLTTTNSIDFEELGNKKTALYVITPADHSTYDYILTIFFSQMLQVLYSQANKNGGTLKNQVYFLLDEFPNIGQIPDFNKKLSTTRSLGMSMSICVQSLDQLEGLYKDTYENIIGNCDTQLFLGSQAIKTCEYVSKSLGQKTIKVQNRSVSKDKDERTKQGVSFSEQRQGRDLMTVDELKRLSPNKEILLVRGCKPILAEKAFYFKYHPLRDEVKRLEIHNITEMPKKPGAPIKTMDVLAHLEKRAQRVQSMQGIQKEQRKEESLDDLFNDEMPKSTPSVTSVNNSVSKPSANTEYDFDLQAELEKKFDELFGSTSNH